MMVGQPTVDAYGDGADNKSTASWAQLDDDNDDVMRRLRVLLSDAAVLEDHCLALKSSYGGTLLSGDDYND